MKRWLFLGTILLALLLIAGAGYLGWRTTRPTTRSGEDGPDVPPTVRVTRGEVLQTVIAPGTLVDTHTAAVSARLAGELIELNVRPGDRVQAGAVIARLGVDELQRQIADAEGELKSAERALSAAETSHAYAIAQAELDLAAAQTRAALDERENAEALSKAERVLAAAREEQDRLQSRSADVTAQVTVAAVELERAEDERARAQIAYVEALDRPWQPQAARDALAGDLQRAEWDLLVAQARHKGALAAQTVYRHDLNLGRMAVGAAEDDLRRLDARLDTLLGIEVRQAELYLAQLEEAAAPPLADRVERAQRALARLRARLADAQIVAPIDGIVLEVLARPGTLVAPGSELILLADPRALEARTTVIEEDLPLVKIGQPAVLYFDAQPESEIQGRVARIVPRRVPGQDRPLYHVYLEPGEELPPDLRSGMTVDASIVIDQRSAVLRLPRSVARARSDGQAQVWLWVDGRAETRAAQVGLRGDVYVEILSGLQEGQEVVAQ